MDASWQVRTLLRLTEPRSGKAADRASVRRSSFANQNALGVDWDVLKFGRCCGSQTRAPLEHINKYYSRSGQTS
jgi:hypothetical protein